MVLWAFNLSRVSYFVVQFSEATTGPLETGCTHTPAISPKALIRGTSKRPLRQSVCVEICIKIIVEVFQAIPFQRVNATRLSCTVCVRALVFL